MSASAYKTIGDAVLDHVEETNGGNGGTGVGVRLLELERVQPPELAYGAGNIYLAALSLLRERANALAEEKQEHQATLRLAALDRDYAEKSQKLYDAASEMLTGDREARGNSVLVPLALWHKLFAAFDDMPERESEIGTKQP